MLKKLMKAMSLLAMLMALAGAFAEAAPGHVDRRQRSNGGFRQA